MKNRIALSFITLLLASNASYAVPMLEVGDAPDLLTGQDVLNGTTSIQGSIGDGDLGDLFGFSWSGGVLTIDAIGSVFDAQLHLFDNVGAGIGESDDGVDGPTCGGFTCPAISLDLAADFYYIAITSFNNDALDALGLPVFGFSNTFNDLAGNFIQGPEGNGPLAAWDGFGNAAGDYSINFSAAVGAPTAAVPEPGTLALLALGILGMGLGRRRRPV